jgi:hypothetical protein
MPQDFRIFVASPGDVSEERQALERVVNELNQTHGPPLGYRLELVQWQTHTAPGAGRPQQVINDQIGSYDIFIGIMWRRFGTPTGVAGWGTEEEFRIAYGAWQRDPRIILMFYFCQEPFMPASNDDIQQMQQVLLFRQELDGKALTWKYHPRSVFADDIRKHLCLRLNRLLEDRSGRSRPQAKPDEDVIHNFKDLWSRMSPDLQDAFSVAYNENRRAGDAGIQTQDLFAALRRIGSESVQRIVEDIPSGALPEPTSGPIADDPYIMQERPWLSHCVASSMLRLGKHLPPDRILTAADVFTDIAKHGTGRSVSLLRQHNIGPAEIDQILKNKNIEVLMAGA